MRKGRHQARCKACINAASRAWALANPERSAEISTNWQRRNKDKVREHNVANYHSDKAKNHDRVAAWKCKNAEKHRTTMKNWRARPEVRDRERKKSASYRAENKQKIKASLAARPLKGRLDASKRRARRAAATVGPVDLDLLWIRQCGVCSICAQRIDRALAHPDPMSKSVDHVTPLARGGTHEQSNLAWTHLVCNLRKGTRPTA